MKTLVAVNQYIAKSADFAIPILEHLRNLVHFADNRLEEKIKWGMPFFEYKGTVCHMAAFKNHCAFGFWKASLMEDRNNIFKEKTGAMGMLGKIKTFDDLPNDEVLISYIKKAVQLNEDGIMLPAKPKTAKPEIKIPQYFLVLLQENPAASRVFYDFSYSNKKDYVIWIEEAKTEATKKKRLETAIEWISEGKPRMWKYLKKN